MEERTGKTPQALLEAPESDSESRWYIEAFFMLTGSRQIGMGVGPIPLSEIIAYGQTFGVIEDLHTFCKVIGAMDAEYIKYTNSKKNSKKG